MKNNIDCKSGDEIEGDFVALPEKSFSESIEEARKLSRELWALQDRLSEHYNFIFSHTDTRRGDDADRARLT